MSDNVTILIITSLFMAFFAAGVFGEDVLKFLERRRREKQAHVLEMERIKLRMLEGPPTGGAA